MSAWAAAVGPKLNVPALLTTISITPNTRLASAAKAFGVLACGQVGRHERRLAAVAFDRRHCVVAARLADTRGRPL
jgi:hypothetical protein